MISGEFEEELLENTSFEIIEITFSELEITNSRIFKIYLSL